MVGDHTMTHPVLQHFDVAAQAKEIDGQATLVSGAGLPYPRLFRPPYGLWNAQTLDVLRGFKMLMVLWTVDTADYRKPGTASIVRSAVAGARPGAIILLHDAGGDRSETVAALPKIIRTLRTRGYTFVTVPKLLLDNPAPANQRISAVIGTGG